MGRWSASSWKDLGAEQRSLAGFILCVMESLRRFSNWGRQSHPDPVAQLLSGTHSLSRPLPSVLALSADHQGPETAGDCRGHAADRSVHPDLLAGRGPPEKDSGEVQHGGKCQTAAGAPDTWGQ